MKAVNWLRSRQEEREIAYWLSFVAYEKSDHSFNNRIYLLYLILFFGVWVFVTLTFFASGGVMLFEIIHPDNPAQAGLMVEIILLAVWSLYSVWQATRRCPVLFSEEDGLLISQTPLPRAGIILRWLWMPWLKNAIPFWVVAVTLGFSLAEVTIPGAMGANRIFEYTGFGIRAWMAILPVHLVLFGLHWLLGAIRLSTRGKSNHWLWIAIPSLALFYGILILSLGGGVIPSVVKIVDLILISLRIGYFDVFNWLVWMMGWLLAFLVLVILYRVSMNFSLSRAIQETGKIELISTASRYGFTSLVEQEKTQRRLGVEQKPTRLPAIAGPGVLIWKDVLQTKRTFRLTGLLTWLQILGFLFVIPVLPDIGSRGIVIILWIIQLAQISVKRIRSDLSVWPLIRQLPLSHKKFLINDLGFTYLLAVLISLAGFLLGGVVFGMQMPGLVLLVPGMIAAISCAAVFDVIRRSRSGLLLNGSVPELSAGGILLGILFTGIPLLTYVLIPGILGMLLSFLLSWGMAYLAFELASYAYRNIDHA
ncbi:MAG: hypothetical protein CVU41_12915 [Chloroflexi bacterium HGW-Chloroflexi-3]|nr:MAG: hypothetical protein CVU41_12915 [Chloroflexi bacterium HGW-Chloroflexi-3]